MRDRLAMTGSLRPGGTEPLVLGVCPIEGWMRITAPGRAPRDRSQLVNTGA
jgi:hypothetical protein